MHDHDQNYYGQSHASNFRHSCHSMSESREAEGPAPVIPEKWYFYNLKQSIDDPHKPFSAAALDTVSGTFDGSLLADPPVADGNTKDMSPGPVAPSYDPDTPLYSQSTLRRTISPIVEWIPFSPADNVRLNAASVNDEPISVGQERLLFQVHSLSSLRPIYWSIPYATRVSGVRWVFTDTLTPIDPTWDNEIFPHFMNFISNVQTYRETLEESISEPSHMRVIAQRLDLKQAGKQLKVDLLFSPMKNWVYVFKSDSSYVCTKHTAAALLSGNVPRGVITVLKPFDFNEYKTMHSLPDRPSDNVDYVPLPINNLILVFHGVGQKLSSSYSRINFVYAIDKLRVEIQLASETPEIYNHFPGGAKESVRSLVLAVNWRSAFNANDTFNVDAITVPSILPIRQAFSDALLDIPLYMSENRRPQMLAAAANEANRLYGLVEKHHPSFKQNGKTHLVGHSLGSLITADLLTHQPSVLNEETIKLAPFKFQTVNYFTTGSMLGVFMVLKGKHLCPREEFDAECEQKGVTCNPQDRPFGCFAVRNLYNIVHQSDLLSFLVNGTVKGFQEPEIKNLTGASGQVLEADELPTRVPGSNSNASDTSPPSSPPHSSSSSTLTSSSSKSSLSRFFSSQLLRFSKDESEVNVSDIEKEETSEVPEHVEEVLRRFKKLNENGQLDWKIPQSASYLTSHYLKMFTAHFDYWSNKEIARFLAIECGREPGEEHTLPEHRVKWAYKLDRKKEPESS